MNGKLCESRHDELFCQFEAGHDGDHSAVEMRGGPGAFRWVVWK